ncbi:hypothetical protein ACVWY3_001007 [Bradyrhizobium sp. USDA 4486]
MKRRHFITTLGVAATWPLAARAQQAAKMKRIAFVNSGGNASRVSVSGPPPFRAFFEELSRLGHVEAKSSGWSVTQEKGERATPNWPAMSSTRIPT